MSDSVRITTHRSWLSRIGGSFAGALIGAAMVVAALAGLFWNEGRAVTTARSLAEGAEAVASVPAGRIDTANEGRLVHVTGALSAGAAPADPSFGIRAEGVRLLRRVEMFQWRESSRSQTEKLLGGGEGTVTTYSYERGWESAPVDSSGFQQPEGHGNPAMSLRDETFALDAAKLGAFDLHAPALDALAWAESLPVTPEQLDAVRAHADRPDVSVIDGAIHLGRNPASPAIGDYRIRYERVPLGLLSLIARQHGSTLDAYPAKAGGRLLLAARGTVPADAMFADAAAGNAVLTWILRGAGLLVLGIGAALVLAPAGVLADLVPVLGSVVRFGTGSIALLFTVAAGSSVMALAWLWYRPLPALGIVVAGLLAGYGVSRIRRRGGSAPHPAAAKAVAA